MNPVTAFAALLAIALIDGGVLPRGTVGKEYTNGPLQALVDVCPGQALKWSVVDGKLPPGLKLTGAGYFTGVAEREGRYRFQVVADGGCSKSKLSYELPVGGSPILEARPSRLEVNLIPGVAPDQKLTVRVMTSEPGVPFTLEASDPRWLKAEALRGTTPPAGSALTADIVTLSLEGAALMPGVHQGWIEVTAWRAANVLRIPLTVNVRPGLSQPETFAIRQVLRPVPIPPLPLVSMPMEGRVQLAKVPPMPVFPKLEPKLAANRQQVGLRRFAATRPVFRGRGRSVSSYKVPEAKPEPVKPADPKAGHGAAPEKKPEPAKAAEAAHGKPADPKAGHGAPEKKPEPAKPAEAAHGKPADPKAGHGAPEKKPEPAKAAEAAHGKPSDPKAGHAAPEKKPEPAKAAEAAHGKPADPKAGHGAPEKKPEPAKPQQAKAGAEHKPEPPKGAAGSHGKPPDPKTTSKGEPAKASPPQKAEAKPGKGTPAADHAKAAHPPVPVPKPSPVGPPVKPASQVKEHH